MKRSPIDIQLTKNILTYSQILETWTNTKYVIEVQWQTQKLVNIPDHKNFYKPLYTVTALPDWKYYKNSRDGLKYFIKPLKFGNSSIWDKQPKYHIYSWNSII